MPDTAIEFGPSLRGLSTADWITEVSGLVEPYGYLERLGRRHMAAFVEDGATLLVTFETLQGIGALSEHARPLGWKMVRNHRWSHLALISDGDTWFRDAALYGYFDRLVDEEFFDEFDRVLFYGAGPCGYAAAVFSVAAPGATVLAVQPQATLDPKIAGWDQRFTEARRTDFVTRYGYAPEMLEAAGEVFVLCDPYQTEDAMHAALMDAPHVTRLTLPHMGAALQTDLLQMGVLLDLLAAAGKGVLTPHLFARHMRARREHLPYLRRLLARLDHDERDGLARLMCQNVSARLNAPRFAARLERLKATGSD
ncbi:phosphoadenosine phosphosulfate reductase [uncultured Roseobacter sp.]|uniref:phosphoadenosine phosphosulfate reductase n=1 Tax=uncultured Roseobacter sp. TaxID=114847 RepID=UPI002620B04D|nr:phosphoadenosine phosphosulfate reductase [uncultured Roseobacter sp.]